MFERKLAWRYIRTQKRHSLLTVCSIAIALAIMTMLFTGFSTVIGCIRDVAYEEGNYHVAIGDLTRQQATAVAEFVSDKGSCTVKTDNNSADESESQEKYIAYILFDKYIGNTGNYLREVAQAARLTMEIDYDYYSEYASFAEDDSEAYYYQNLTLIRLDMVTLQARYELAQIFALFYIFVLFFVVALRLVIDTAFEVSSKERERQFGILQSIGATPRQTAGIITIEGLLLSVVGIPVGVASGIGLAYAAYRAVLSSGVAEAYFSASTIEKVFHFHISPLLVAIGAVTGLVWVMLSAYGTGMRIVRMSPVQAISMRKNTVKKVKKHSLFGAIFGWKGRLASRNNMRQKKRFVITILSLTISITLFSATSIVLKYIRQTYEDHFDYDYGTEDLEIHYYNDDKNASLDDYRTALRLLEDSGYFSEIYISNTQNADFSPSGDYERHEVLNDDGYYEEYNDIEWVFITYYSKDSYLKLFDSKPPVSYEELTAQNGYILLYNGEDYAEKSDIPKSGIVSMQIQEYISYTMEEYEAMSPEEQEGLLNFGTDEEPHYVNITNNMYDYNIVDFAVVDHSYEIQIGNMGYLIGTLDEYENGEYKKYGSGYSYFRCSCNIADNVDYNDILAFVENNDAFDMEADRYGARIRFETTISAVGIGVTFLLVMIAMIAVVNMVNILSTGILNRRGELAAMQCVGMTRRQLYAMTVIECLQYALSAAVISAVLCELLMFATFIMLDDMGLIVELGDFISYIAPLLKVAAASAAAFVIALLASFLPLRGLEKQSLVDQIRSVD